MNDYKLAMSKRSDFELFEILKINSENYKPEALAAAKDEFDKRMISENLILEFEQKIKEEISKSKSKRHQQNLIKNKLSKFLSLIIPRRYDSVPKTILSLCVFLSIVYLFHLGSDFQMIVWFLRNPSSWDLSVLQILIPFLFIPFGIFGLYKNQKYGWFIIIGVLIHELVSKIFALIATYLISESGDLVLGEELDSFFVLPNIFKISIQAIVLLGIIGFLLKKENLKWINIRPRTVLIFITAVLIPEIVNWWNQITYLTDF